jgi:hypothetical protein
LLSPGLPCELDALHTNRIGVGTGVDLVLPIATPPGAPGKLASLDRRATGWVVVDHAVLSGGVYVNGGRAAPECAVAPGDVVTIGGCRLVFREVERGPLDDVSRCGSWLLFGSHAPLGRLPTSAFRLDGGQLVRGGLLARPQEAILRKDIDLDASLHGMGAFSRVLDRWVDGDDAYFVFEDTAGPRALSMLRRASVARGTDDVALAAHLIVKTFEGLDVPRGRWAFEVGDIVITWDGALRFVPEPTAELEDGYARALAYATASMANMRGDDPLLDALGQALEATAPWSAARARAAAAALKEELLLYDVPPLQDLLRALFPDEWREEQELREQLATLDEDAVRWLLER